MQAGAVPGREGGADLHGQLQPNQTACGMCKFNSLRCKENAWRHFSDNTAKVGVLHTELLGS